MDSLPDLRGSRAEVKVCILRNSIGQVGPWAQALPPAGCIGLNGLSTKSECSTLYRRTGAEPVLMGVSSSLKETTESAQDRALDS